ncbi:MAG: hypothetical protein HOP29_07445 [Phycisphaerales bacterium]|nr:hypothetical protein [Phycisphaerales bacterium]
MYTASVKSQLSGTRHRLVERMQELGFGRIEALLVRACEPVLDPPPKVTREVKFGAENGARPEQNLRDFVLKSQVIELFDEFDRIGDGVIDVLTVKHGLPFSMNVNQTAGAR